MNARRNVETFPPREARFVRFTVEETNRSQVCIDELEIFSGETNVALAKTGAAATSSGDFVHPKHRLATSTTGNTATAAVGSPPTRTIPGFKSSWPNRRPSGALSGHATGRESTRTGSRRATGSKSRSSPVSGKRWPARTTAGLWGTRPAEATTIFPDSRRRKPGRGGAGSTASRGARGEGRPREIDARLRGQVRATRPDASALPR